MKKLKGALFKEALLAGVNYAEVMSVVEFDVLGEREAVIPAAGP